MIDFYTNLLLFYLYAFIQKSRKYFVIYVFIFHFGSQIYFHSLTIVFFIVYRKISLIQQFFINIYIKSY